jgi:regulator of sigma E protease
LGLHLIASIAWFFDPAHWLIILKVGCGLGFVIFVHELGHFLVAKACGVKCEKFYLGFDIYGLKFCKFQWGETEYGIGILPLGGYVKMLGQDDNPARMAEETRRSKLQPVGAGVGATSDSLGANGSASVSDHAPPLTHGDLPSEPVSDPHEPYDPRSYMAQSVPKRMAIISAGVIMNVIFAFVMASIAYGLGVKEVPCIVRGVVPGGAAWQANLQPGDVVQRIGKIENPRFRDLITGVTLGDIENGIEFQIKRPVAEKTFIETLHPDTSLGVPMIGIVGPWSTTLIDDSDIKPTLKNSRARQAEPAFEPGDRILKINDMPVESDIDIERALVKFADEPIAVTVERAADKTATPKKADNADAAAENLKTVTIKVEPTSLRGFGLQMTISPVTAVQPNSPAAEKGIRAGDRLISIAGQPIGDPITLPIRVRRLAEAGKPISVVVERDVDNAAKQLTFDIQPRVPQFDDEILPTGQMSIPALGIAYKVSTKVAAVDRDSPAAKGGIKPGEEVTSIKLIPPADEKKAKGDQEQPDSATIDFEKDPAWPYFVLELLPFIDPQTQTQFQIRDGKNLRTVELQSVEWLDDSGKPFHISQRGLAFQQQTTLRTANTFAEAIQLGAQETRDNLMMVFRFLGKIGRQVPVTGVAGPIEIFRQAGNAAKQGIPELLLFLTMLSANLAVLNFLPIPLLDGGHMVFLLYEGIRGKPASEKVIIAFTYAGLVFLLSLMMFVLALDTHLISRR